MGRFFGMNVVGLVVVSHGFVVAENWIKPPPPSPPFPSPVGFF